MKSSRLLFAGILLFIALDLSILLINYWIAFQVSSDAVAINLAGRQRMLSQRITKSLLSLQLNASGQDKAASIQELRSSAHLFDQTLSAFELGGKTIGGDGVIATLHRVKHGPGLALLSKAQQIWQPTRDLLSPYFDSQQPIPDQVIAQTLNQMLSTNVQLLDAMNRLTTTLQMDSMRRASNLRVIQTIVFFLALINFLAIVRRFHLLHVRAHEAKEHFIELSARDPLTGLYNRREFENNLKREISAVHRRTQDKFAIVLLDLDGFKPINDQYGHKTGDSVLRKVAKRIESHARSTDTVARIGGDEFVLICTTLQDEEDAAKFCKRLLDSINDPIKLEAGEVQVGASIGVTFYSSQTKSGQDLMHMVDEAMYAAKNSGRNRYVFYHEQ